MRKMNKIKKVVVLGGTMLVSLLCAGLFMQPTQTASAASEKDLKNPTIVGASVRYAKNGEAATSNGIRFAYTFDSSVIDVSKVQNMGILLIPSVGLSGELTQATQDAEDVQFIKDGVKVHNYNVGEWANGKFTVKAEGTAYGMFAYVYNLPTEAYNADFTCVGYYQLKDGDMIYTAAEERSMAYVANKALQDASYTNETQKASLESFLLDYTVTYVAGEGTATMASETLEYGKAFTATATLDGYDFDFWGVDGEKVETITGDMTVSAHYKKDGGALTASIQNGVSVDYAGADFVSVKVGESDVTEKASLAGGKLTVSGSAFATEGNYTLTVNETANKKATYSVTVVNMENSPFVFADADNLVVGSPFSYENNKHKMYSSQEFDGRKGLIRFENYVSDTEGFAITANLKDKTYYESLYNVENTYVTFEFYITSSSSSHIYWDINGAANGYSEQTGSVTVGQWHRISTPLSDILKKHDKIATAYTSANTSKNILEGWLFRSIIPTDKSFNLYMTPMYLTTMDIDDMGNTHNKDSVGIDVGAGVTTYEAEVSAYKAANLDDYKVKATLDGTVYNSAEVNLPTEEGTYTYTVYAEDTQGATYTLYVAEIAVANSSLDRAFTSIDTSHAKVLSWGSAKSEPSIVNNPKNKTGDYFHVNTNVEGPGLRILPTVSEATLNLYADGYLTFEYYVVNTNNWNYINVLYKANDDYFATEKSVPLNTWCEAEIPVSELLDSSSGTSAFDNMVNNFSVAANEGKLVWFNGTGVEFYLGNIQLISKESFDAKVEAEKNTPLAWQDIVSVSGYGLTGYKVSEGTTILKDDMDAAIVKDATIDSAFYYTCSGKSSDMTPVIYIPTTLLKTDLEKRVEQYLVFEYYVSSTNDYTVKHMLGSNASEYSSIANGCNEWRSIAIPVQYIVDNYSAFTKSEASLSNAILKLQWLANDTVTFYVSEMKIMAYNPDA